MTKVLLTGGTGFLGSRVAALLREKYEVVAVVRDEKNAPAGCTAVVADLSDKLSSAKIREAAKGCTVLMHIAATMPSAAVPTDSEKSLQSLQTDIVKHLMVVCPDVQHVIFASSVDVYGNPAALPVTEETPTAPVTPYAIAKIEVENYLKEFCKTNKKILTILRLTHIYGPAEPCIKAIPRFISGVVKNTVPTLFGDGSDLRDFIYVDDAAAAFVSAMENKSSGVFNIATGRSVSLKQTLDTIIEVSGKKIAPILNERQKPKIDLRFDIKKARRTLGLNPTTPFRDGIKAEYDWYSTHTS